MRKSLSNAVPLEDTPFTDSLEEFFNDEDLWSDLIDSINQNFVMEVKDSHAHDE